jgi:hypothetical protein
MTPEEVHAETKRDYRELSLQIRELRIEVLEQLQKIRLLIWLPVIASTAQIITQLMAHFHWL